MTLNDLKALPVVQTKSIAAAAEDAETHNYIVDCLLRLYAGDYGELCQDDIDANNDELAAGEGRIVARYKQAHQLTGDIYIIACFDAGVDDINANYITVIYCSEY